MLGTQGHVPLGPLASPLRRQLGTRRLQNAATFYSWGFTGWAGGELLLNCVCIFWSFLRDTFSHEPPAWSHLLRGGLWGWDHLSKHSSYVCCLCSARLKSTGSEGSVCRGVNIPEVGPTSLWLAAPQCPAMMWILAPPAWPHTEDQPHNATARGAQGHVQHLMGRRLQTRGAWRAAPSPLGRSAGGLKVPESPMQPFSFVKVNSRPPKPTLYILGLFCPCGAAKGLLKCQLAARAVASAHSVPWHSLGPGSAQCLGLWDRCHHGCARETRSPGASPCHPAPGCAHLQPCTAKLWHTSAAASSPIFFFFSSSFLLGVGGGRGGRISLSMWMLGNKTLHKPLGGCLHLPPPGQRGSWGQEAQLSPTVAPPLWH